MSYCPVCKKAYDGDHCPNATKQALELGGPCHPEEVALMEKIKKEDFQTLLERWRFAAMGDPHFQGAIGLFYRDEMNRKRALLPDNGVGASKRIGWSR